MRLSEETRRLLDSFEEPSRFYLISESCGLQVRRFRNVLIGRHRNRMKPYEKQEQMFYHYSHSMKARGKHHYVALSGVARKLAGVCLSLMREQRPYESEPPEHHLPGHLQRQA